MVEQLRLHLLHCRKEDGKKDGEQLNLKDKEAGQSLVEFAFASVILILMLTVPVDLFRYATTTMALNSAATEAVTCVSADHLDSAYALSVAEGMYADRLDNLAVAQFNVSADESEYDYTYRVYSSDLKGRGTFSNQFESRDSNYHCKTVELQLSCTWSAVTPLGCLFLGSGEMPVESKVFTCDVYTEGYRK